MNTQPTASYKRHRFPAEIISHAVWLYFRFPLRYRDVDELLAERGMNVTYETIRPWCQKFGQHDAKQLRRRRAQPGDTWHLDEVFIKINGKQQYLWRAVDQHGVVLDIRLCQNSVRVDGRKEVMTYLSLVDLGQAACHPAIKR